MVGHPAGVGTLLAGVGETLPHTHTVTGDQNSYIYTQKWTNAVKML